MRRLALLCLALCACATTGGSRPRGAAEDEAALEAFLLEERDELPAAARAYLALLSGQARNDAALALAVLDRLDALAAGGLLDQAARAALERLDGTRLPVDARRGLKLVRARVLRMAGDEDRAQAEEREAGCRQPWTAGAPLGALPRLDLARPLVAAAFRADSGAVARARGCRVLLVTPDGRPGALPAALAVTLAEPAELELLVAGDQAHRVWVDEVAAPIPDEHASTVRRHRYRLHLPAGSHRVAVVVAATHGRSELELALLGPRTMRTQASDGRAGTGAASLSERPTIVALPANALGDYLALIEAARAGDVARTRTAMAQLLARSSVKGGAAAALGLALAARVAAEDPTIPARIARDRARRLFERALAADPRLSRVRYEAGRLALDRDRPRDALELGLAAPRPPSFHVALLMSEALRARNRDAEVRASLEQMRALAPEACALAEGLLSDERLRHRPVDLAVARRAAICRPGSTALAEALRHRGELEAALVELRRIVAIDPGAEGARAALGEALSERGLHADAARVYRDLVSTARRSTTYRLRLVDALVAGGRREEARAALLEGVALDPESTELTRARTSLSRREGTRALPIDLDHLDGRNVIAEFEAQKRRYEGAAVFVLDRTVSRVYPTGAQRTLTHNIVKVLAKEGIDRWGEWNIPENAELLTLCAWKPDGRRLEPEEIPEKESISLPGLAVGDYVEVEYAERAAAPAAFPGGFLSERFYFASFDAPLDRSEYLLVTPRGWSVALDRRGGAPEPALSQREEPDGPVDVRRFSVREIAQRQAEPASVPAAEFLPSVRASARVEVGAWRDYLAELAWGTRRRDVAITELAASLVAGARDERERLARLDRWVRTNIKQGGSVEDAATAILARREGNRATLLAALADAAGLHTRLLLARSLRAADVPLDLEGYDALLVEVGGIVDDPRARHGRPGELPPQLRGAAALPLVLGGTPLVLPKDSPDRRRMKVQMVLQRDGSGRVEIEERLTGWPAVEWRESLALLPPDRVRPAFEQRTLAHFFPGARLSSLTWEGESDDDRPFVVRYQLEAPRLARRLGEALVLPAPFAAVLARRYATSAERQSPLYTDEVAETELELDVALPAGLRAAVAPPARHDTAHGRFSQEARLEGDHLRLRSRFFLPTQRIGAADAASFVSWAEAVDRAEATAAQLIAAPESR